MASKHAPKNYHSEKELWWTWGTRTPEPLVRSRSSQPRKLSLVSRPNLRLTPPYLLIFSSVVLTCYMSQLKKPAEPHPYVPALPVCAEHTECAPSPSSALPSRHPEGQPFRPEGSHAIGTRTRCFAPLSMSAVRIAPGLRRSRLRPGRFCGTEKPSFLIATRAYSRRELTHCKQRVKTLSNRNKIHFCNQCRRPTPPAMDSTQLSSQSSRTVGVNHV